MICIDLVFVLVLASENQARRLRVEPALEIELEVTDPSFE
jgi:hypothetical protein